MNKPSLTLIKASLTLHISHIYQWLTLQVVVPAGLEVLLFFRYLASLRCKIHPLKRLFDSKRVTAPAIYPVAIWQRMNNGKIEYNLVSSKYEKNE